MMVIELLLVAAILAAVAWPIVKPAAEGPEMDEGDPYHQLLFRRDATYQQIKELDFDYKTGKIDEEDYEELKGEYQAQAVSILKAIDEYEKHGRLPADAVKPASAPSPSPQATSAPAKFCSQCGAGLGDKARFCSQCGTQVS